MNGATGNSRFNLKLAVLLDSRTLEIYTRNLLADAAVKSRRFSSDDPDLIAGLAAFAPERILIRAGLVPRDGYEICALLKATRATRRVRITMVSRDESVVQLFADYGADSYLQIPFSRDQLFQVIGVGRTVPPGLLIG